MSALRKFTVTNDLPKDDLQLYFFENKPGANPPGRPPIHRQIRPHATDSDTISGTLVILVPFAARFKLEIGDESAFHVVYGGLDLRGQRYIRVAITPVIRQPILSETDMEVKVHPPQHGDDDGQP